eukprot:9287253-Pyramimonas_sp.AAC.1
MRSLRGPQNGAGQGTSRERRRADMVGRRTSEQMRRWRLEGMLERTLCTRARPRLTPDADAARSAEAAVTGASSGDCGNAAAASFA